MTLNRDTPSRRLILALGLACLARPVASQEEARLSYKGFEVDLSAGSADRREAVTAYVRRQIDLVDGLVIKPDIKAYFRTVPITISPDLRIPGEFRNNTLTLADGVFAAENPILLHELLHAYRRHRLTGGPLSPDLLRHYEEAKAKGTWPADAYMYQDVSEFFSMTGSVALWGRAARPPSTRAELQAALPDCYAWLVAEFGLVV